MKIILSSIEMEKFYLDSLSSYKTDGAKKSFLSRCRKQIVSYLEDVNAAVAFDGYLHGDKYFQSDVLNIENEIKVIDKIYSQL